MENALFIRSDLKTGGSPKVRLHPFSVPSTWNAWVKSGAQAAGSCCWTVSLTYCGMQQVAGLGAA